MLRDAVIGIRPEPEWVFGRDLRDPSVGRPAGGLEPPVQRPWA